MLALYEIAEQNNITIYTGSLPATRSLSIPGYVALDYNLMWNSAEERTRTAHELGHCIRFAFYRRDDPRYIKKRCENKADKWAIKNLVPKDELEEAVASGYTEPWQLAEYFAVTDEFMFKALWYYRNGNLAVEGK